jgi:hypothetical protein
LAEQAQQRVDLSSQPGNADVALGESFVTLVALTMHASDDINERAALHLIEDGCLLDYDRIQVWIETPNLKSAALQTFWVPPDFMQISTPASSNTRERSRPLPVCRKLGRCRAHV